MSDLALWTAITGLHTAVEHQLTAALHRHGLGLSEFRALDHLATAPDGELRMQDLAERIGLNQSSVTRLVARLNSAGLTYRDVCADDKRGIYAVITPDGRARHTEAATTYARALTEALDGADAEAATIVATLRARSE